ncbi:transglutaminase [Planctomycetota bacterium]|nr:transglutaminase [Planctomycetota bacterium]
MNAMRYRLRHVTTYQYEEPVALSLNVARLRPRGDGRQRLIASRLHVSPVPAVERWRTDWFGNSVDVLTIQTAHRELVVSAESEVEIDEIDPSPHRSPGWEDARSALGRDPVVSGYVFESPHVPVSTAFAAYAAASFPAGMPLAQGALALCERIRQEFIYDQRATTVATPVARVLADRRGVCQDFAHLMIAGLRSLGLPARYVSGYLETDPPPGRVKLRGADASHAWVSVWCPANGWIDLDPTNGCVVGVRHIALAIGRDFHDASPLKGVVVGGGHQTVSVAVDVERDA